MPLPLSRLRTLALAAAVALAGSGCSHARERILIRAAQPCSRFAVSIADRDGRPLPEDRVHTRTDLFGAQFTELDLDPAIHTYTATLRAPGVPEAVVVLWKQPGDAWDAATPDGKHGAHDRAAWVVEPGKLFVGAVARGERPPEGAYRPSLCRRRVEPDAPTLAAILGPYEFRTTCATGELDGFTGEARFRHDRWGLPWISISGGEGERLDAIPEQRDGRGWVGAWALGEDSATVELVRGDAPCLVSDVRFDPEGERISFRVRRSRARGEPPRAGARSLDCTVVGFKLAG